MTDDELENKLELARRAVPSWTLARQQQAVWRARGELRRRRKAVMTLGGLSAAAAAGALFWMGVQRVRAPSDPEIAIVASSASSAAGFSEHWNLRDGSLISLETRSTVIRKKLETARELVLELDAGAADFDVAHRPERAFLVHSGNVTVKVTGTRFRVEKKGEQSSVSVRRGSVLVAWPGGSRSLAAGDNGVFPPLQPAAARSNPPASAASLEQRKDVAPSTTSKSSAAPQDAVRGGLSESEALFARSDRARSEGRPAEAAALLKTLAERYPRDPRAPLAAFTRGRILLESLGRPGEAAAAFSQARALSQSAIAEDALAREVEAYRAAGDLSRARDRAELYRRVYPNGVRLRQVMRSGGLPENP
jgi:transmembrane sensor